METKGLNCLCYREREVAVLASQGLSNKEIGNTLKISPYTVRNHLANCYRLLKIGNRVHLTRVVLGFPTPIPPRT